MKYKESEALERPAIQKQDEGLKKGLSEGLKTLLNLINERPVKTIEFKA